MPCVYHKREGRLCEGCENYDRIETRILVVKLGAVGDVLRTTSILPALRQKYPGVEITWVTRTNAAPLLQSNPLIDRVLLIEENHLEYLQNESFSVGICLDADSQSATIHSIARCGERFGFVTNSSGKVRPANEAAAEWWLMGINDGMKRRNRKTYQQIMYEICRLPLPVARPQLYLNGSHELVSIKICEETALGDARKIVGINTGGGGRWQLKKWTFEGYVECIRLLQRCRPEVGVLLLGGPDEVNLNEQIMRAVGEKISDGGCHNSLLEFAGKIRDVDVLLTADSLAMHIGVALERPTVVLVGPTSPWELDVFGKGAVLFSDIECLACYRARCDKAINCMNTLSPERALSKISEFL
jgi:heptosyltransferase-2